MLCPYCQTENRDDREDCYYCQKDLSMLRLIVNKAKHHYNQGLEYAERNRPDEALRELENAVDLDASLANAHVVMGTIYAQREDFKRAAECWNRALALDHRFEKAHGYLAKLPQVEHVMPVLRNLRYTCAGLGAFLVVALLALIFLPRTKLSADEKYHLKAVRKMYEAKDAPAAAAALNAMLKKQKISPKAREIIGGMAAKLGGGAMPADGDLPTTATMLQGDAATSATALYAGPQFILAAQALKDAKPYEAADALGALVLANLSPEDRQRADALKTEATDAALAQLQADAKACMDRKLEYEVFQKNADAFIAHFAASPKLAVATNLLDQVSRDQLAQNSKMDEAEAREAWAWFEERDGRFEAIRISEEDARRAIDLHARLIASLPKDLRYTRGPIYYYTAVAYYKLGQLSAARDYAEKVVKEFPKSYVFKPASEFAARISDKKNTPKPAETPTVTPEAPPATPTPAAEETSEPLVAPVKK